MWYFKLTPQFVSHLEPLKPQCLLSNPNVCGHFLTYYVLFLLLENAFVFASVVVVAVAAAHNLQVNDRGSASIYTRLWHNKYLLTLPYYVLHIVVLIVVCIWFYFFLPRSCTFPCCFIKCLHTLLRRCCTRLRWSCHNTPKQTVQH